ncbi:hypothetical protein [Roseburia hominis]|uniref:hypothetical protein n=1 Tax=Roseburia hominis TaxID=301301 RepID=UPI0035207892
MREKKWYASLKTAQRAARDLKGGECAMSKMKKEVVKKNTGVIVKPEKLQKSQGK